MDPEQGRIGPPQTTDEVSRLPWGLWGQPHRRQRAHFAPSKRRYGTAGTRAWRRGPVKWAECWWFWVELFWQQRKELTERIRWAAPVLQGAERDAETTWGPDFVTTERGFKAETVDFSPPKSRVKCCSGHRFNRPAAVEQEQDKTEATPLLYSSDCQASTSFQSTRLHSTPPLAQRPGLLPPVPAPRWRRPQRKPLRYLHHAERVHSTTREIIPPENLVEQRSTSTIMELPDKVMDELKLIKEETEQKVLNTHRGSSILLYKEGNVHKPVSHLVLKWKRAETCPIIWT